MGIYFIWGLLKDSYDWIVSKYSKGEYFRNIKRFSYLDNLKDNQTIYDTWKLIWETEKQRMGLDETKLIEKFFSTYDNSEDKDSFLYLYYSAFTVDRENHDVVQEFLYKEFIRISENWEKNSKDANLYGVLQAFYLKYMEQCYYDELLVNNFIKGFDDFFSNEDEKTIERFFINNVDIRMIEIIRNSKIISEQLFILKKYLPRAFQYEDVEDNKKRIVSNIFSKWLSHSYKNNNSDLFATTLFEVMFQKADPIVFFRLIEFVLYVNNHPYSYSGLISDPKKTLVDYSNEKIKFMPIGRSHTFWGENDEKVAERFIEVNNKEKKWSYEYILRLDNRDFFIIQNKELLNLFIDAIKEILDSEFQELTTSINKKRLEILRSDFNNLNDLIDKK